MSQASLDRSVPDYDDAVGRTERTSAVIDRAKAEALANALDLPQIPNEGILPPGWHWMFFNPFVRRSELGVDGHPKRGGFLPAVALPRRMWAGGRLTYHASLPLDVEAVRESEITKVSSKSGRSGQLVFVTVQHRISHGGVLCVTEEQDIVYRDAADPAAPVAVPPRAPEGATLTEAFVPDPVLLFRYSALTSNGHRIHYDAPYARSEEGYRDLVVHGPLIATLLQGLAARSRPGSRLVGFEFRGVSPLTVDRSFHLELSDQANGDRSAVWAKGSDGELAMQGEARFEA